MMSILEQYTRRLPLLPPILMAATVAGMAYWVLPERRQWVIPMVILPIVLMLGYHYQQYRRGNRAPLERFAFRAAVVTLSLAVLALMNWLWA